MNVRDFEVQVAEALEAAGIPFERDAPVAGLRVDFLVQTPIDRSVVIEVKTYGNGIDAELRAYEQCRYLQEATGADAVFVVLPSAPRHGKTKEVVSLRGLMAALRKEMGRQTGRGKGRLPVRHQGLDVFAAMPISPDFNDVYYVAMVGACNSLGATCKRVDQEEFDGGISERIKDMIRTSNAVIADLTGNNPNVLYEVGFAHALGLPAIHVSSSPLSELPFDVRDWNTIPYERGNTSSLTPQLVTRLGAELGRE